MIQKKTAINQAVRLTLEIDTPRWAVPLLEPSRYKGADGGRSGGKSHFFAELLIEAIFYNPNLQWVCIREIQKSLKFSAKKLLEDKIKKFGLEHLFDITLTEIRRIGGDGIIIFQGMQDHTADSIKSLEGFDGAWVEEAQSLSARSLELLLPTIRKAGSEIWFTWNPDNENDAVEEMRTDPDMVLIQVNYYDNPFLSKEAIREAEKHKIRKPETFDHVWLGGYNKRNEAAIFLDKWKIEEFEPVLEDILDDDGKVEAKAWDPLHGLDFGFSQDPTAAVRCYVENDYLYIYQEAGGIGLDLDVTKDKLEHSIPDISKYTIRADSARPESISYLRKHGMANMISVKKWSGSVEDGIEWIKSLKGIVVHPSCTEVIDELKLYSYKIDKRTGDILPDIVDKHNHYIDAIRYALQPLIKGGFIFE